ncbi:MAG: hypothetical protein HZB40_17455 [Rhodocyclales bacterium]|nr:hypothetical protein [Rhodocyclales bacterium]
MPQHSAVATRALRDATPKRLAILGSGALARSHALALAAVAHAVGAPRPAWRELDDEAMENYVIADNRQAAENESGDVILSGATVHCEIGEVLVGEVAVPAGRTVIFKALG